jgi:lambda family phage tail tape measure protein
VDELRDKSRVRRLQGREQERAQVEATYQKELRDLQLFYDRQVMMQKEGSDKRIAGEQAFADATIAIEQERANKLAKLNESFGAGIQQGLMRLEERYRDHAAKAEEIVLGGTAAFESALSDSLTAAENDWKNFGDAMRDIGAGFARTIQKMINDLIAFQITSQIVLGITGVVGGGGRAGEGDTRLKGGQGYNYGKNRGGPVHAFDGGGYVPGPRINRDIVNAKLTPGEFVQPREAVDHIGEERMQWIREQKIAPEELDWLMGRRKTGMRRSYSGGGPVGFEGGGAVMAGARAAAAPAPVIVREVAGATMIQNVYISAADSQDVQRLYEKNPDAFFGMMRRGRTTDRSTINTFRRRN